MLSIKDNPYLVDISNFGVIRISGSSSGFFLSTMLTADIANMEIGQSEYSLMLSSEAEIIDILLVIKSGDYEYVLICNAANFDESLTWLTAHSEISDEAGKVFEDVLIENQSGNVALFMLFGSDALGIGCEEESFSALCFQGVVLDLKIKCDFLSETPENLKKMRLLIMPESFSEQIMNFFLSYPELEVISTGEYFDVLNEIGLSFDGLLEDAYKNPKESKMMHLLRSSQDFVGAKKLGSYTIDASEITIEGLKNG